MTPQRMKKLDDTLILTPKSSVKSSKNWSARRGSFYFPGCRKDTNCNCEICIASINATLDLMPNSSLTKLSISRPKIQRSPVPFPLSHQFVPRHQKSSFKRENNFRVYLVRFLLGLILVFGFSGVFNSWLSPEIVKDLAEISRIHQTLNARHLFLKNGNKVSSCRSADSVLKENQWSSREGNYSVCRANSLPEQEKWSSSSVVQFDPNTWILEYKQSFLLENSKPTLMLLKVRLTRGFEKFKKELCRLKSALFRQPSNILVVPT